MKAGVDLAQCGDLSRIRSLGTTGSPLSPEVQSWGTAQFAGMGRSEEHTSELQSRLHLVCRLLLEKKTNADLVLAGRSRARRCDSASSGIEAKPVGVAPTGGGPGLCGGVATSAQILAAYSAPAIEV